MSKLKNILESENDESTINKEIKEESLYNQETIFSPRIIIGFDDIELTSDKAELINTILKNANSNIALEPFENLTFEQLSVKPIQLKKNEYTRDAAIKQYRNITDKASIKKKIEKNKNSLNELLLSESDFTSMLNRKRVKYNSEYEGIEDFMNNYTNERKEKNKKKNTFKNFTNYFSNDKKPKINEIFNNKGNDNNFNSIIFNNNGKSAQRRKADNFDKLSESRTSYFENADLLKNKLTNNGSHFCNNKINLYNNIENDLSEMNLNFDSRDNSVFLENEKDLYKCKTKSKENKNFKNTINEKSEPRNPVIYKAKIQNFFEDYNSNNKVTQIKMSNKKLKESDSIQKSTSSEKIDINEIKQETSSVKSVRSRTKNEFEKLEIDIRNQPNKMQLRDRTKLNSKNKDSDTKSQNSNTNYYKNSDVINFNKPYNNIYNEILGESNIKSNFYDNKDFNSIDIYRKNHAESNNIENIIQINFEKMQNYFEKKFENMKNYFNNEFKRYQKFVEKKLNFNQNNTDKNMIKIAKKLSEILKNKFKNIQKSKGLKTEKTNKNGGSNNQNPNNNYSNCNINNENNEVKKKKERKPKKPKISQMEREDLNLKIQDVKSSTIFIRGFKKLFNIKGENEYNLSMNDIKDDLFWKLRDLVNETIMKLNEEDDKKKPVDGNNIDDNIDVKSVLSNNLIINNNMNPRQNKFKNVLDDSVSESLSSSSDNNQSIDDLNPEDFINTGLNNQRKDQVITDIILNNENHENDERNFMRPFDSNSAQDLDLSEKHYILKTPTNKNFFEQNDNENNIQSKMDLDNEMSVDYFSSLFEEEKYS